MNEASIISGGDMSTVAIGVYSDGSMDMVSLFQSMTGLNVFKKLIPSMISPVANSSMTIADMLNLILQSSKVIITISLVVATDPSASITV